MKTRIAVFACILGIFTLPATITAQLREYLITFTVISAKDKRPLGDAVIQVTGPRVSSVEGGQGASVGAVTGNGVQPNAAGRLTLYLEPGQYTVTVRHSAHEAQVFAVRVPAAGYENIPRQNYGFIELKEEENSESDAESKSRRRQERTESRTLTVTVLGEKRDATGRVTTVPIANARVQPQSEEFGVGSVNLTNRSGVVSFSRGYEIGTQMRVTASAEGYETQEQSLIIGSRQERALDPRYTNRTTTSDQLTITLRQKKETSYGMIVEVVNADNGAPISGARVVIELIGASQVAAGSTNTDGRTRPLAITPLPGFSKHAQYRAKVTARGYEEKWSDIPLEIPYLSDTSPYVVHLRPSSKTSADEGTDDNISGTYDVTVSVAEATYVLRWEIQRGSRAPVSWNIKETVLGVEHGAVDYAAKQRLVGRTWNGSNIQLGGPRYEYRASNNPISFDQPVTCSFSAESSGSVSFRCDNDRIGQSGYVRIRGAKTNKGVSNLPPSDLAGTSPSTTNTLPAGDSRRDQSYTPEQIKVMRQWIAYYDDLTKQWTQYRDQRVAPYLNDPARSQAARTEYQRSNQQIQILEQWKAYYRTLLQRAGVR